MVRVRLLKYRYDRVAIIAGQKDGLCPMHEMTCPWRDVTELLSRSRASCSSPILPGPTFLDSPRMIPSRTVFNHCKWIYIELAITGAHSGMGPLCISPAVPTPAARCPGECFPHFIPTYYRLQPLDSRHRLPASSPPVRPPRAFHLSPSLSLFVCIAIPSDVASLSLL